VVGRAAEGWRAVGEPTLEMLEIAFQTVEQRLQPSLERALRAAEYPAEEPLEEERLWMSRQLESTLEATGRAAKGQWALDEPTIEIAFRSGEQRLEASLERALRAAEHPAERRLAEERLWISQRLEPSLEVVGRAAEGWRAVGEPTLEMLESAFQTVEQSLQPSLERALRAAEYPAEEPLEEERLWMSRQLESSLEVTGRAAKGLWALDEPTLEIAFRSGEQRLEASLERALRAAEHPAEKRLAKERLWMSQRLEPSLEVTGQAAEKWWAVGEPTLEVVCQFAEQRLEPSLERAL
jgi:hypothetical protein